MAKACTFTFAMFVKMSVVSGSGEIGNCMYAVNAACDRTTESAKLPVKHLSKSVCCLKNE